MLDVHSVRSRVRIRPHPFCRTAWLVAVLLGVSACRIRREGPATEKKTGLPAAQPPDAAPARSPEHSAAPRGGPRPELRSDAGATLADESVVAPAGAVVVALGGIDLSAEADGPAIRAMRLTTLRLLEGRTAVESAAAGVALLENDSESPTAKGAPLRHDGRTIECDAAVMSGTGVFRSVAAVRDTANPVVLAAALLDHDLHLLAGEGTSRFARELGLPRADWLTEHARQELQAGGGLSGDGGTEAEDPLPALGGSAAPSVDAGLSPGVEARVRADEPAGSAGASGAPQPAGKTALHAEIPARSDAVGGAVAVIVRDGSGMFAAAASSAGPPRARVGRVTEVAAEGGAIFAGKEGAVAVSGPSSELAGARLARDVYQRLRIVRVPDVAARWGASRVRGPVVVAVLGELGSAVHTTRPTAWAENRLSGESSSGTEAVNPAPSRPEQGPALTPPRVVDAAGVPPAAAPEPRGGIERKLNAGEP